MKLFGRTLLILIAFLSHYYIYASLNVKSILTQISKGDLSKEDVIKFYNKDFDPMLEYHKIFTPCLNHLIDQEMKTESLLTNIIQSIKEFFSSSYKEYSIPDLGMKIKCETYINKLVSPDYIEKKKAEILDMKKKLLATTQASMHFRSTEESSNEANKNNKKNNNNNKHQKYSLNNKLKNKDIKIENNGEQGIAAIIKANETPISNNNNHINNNQINNNSIKEEKIEYQVNPQKLLNQEQPKNNKLNNKVDDAICITNLQKQKQINDLLVKEKELLQKSLQEKSLEFTKVNDDNCKCAEAKNKLDTELTQCKKEKTEIQISNTKEKSKEQIQKFVENNPNKDETVTELKNKITENQKLNEANIKCKHDLEILDKKFNESQEALKAQKDLGDKLLKENSRKLNEDKEKIDKELKACSEKAEKKADNKIKKQKFNEVLSAKDNEIKNLNEKLKFCEKEKNDIINTRNQKIKTNSNLKNNIVDPLIKSGTTVVPNDPKIKINEPNDVKIDQIIPASDSNLTELANKLKTCEDKNSQDDSKILELNKKVAESQEKMNILINKIDKETSTNLEKESEMKKLKDQIKTKNDLYNSLKESCDKNHITFESQKNKLMEETKSLNTQVSECSKREKDLISKEKLCNEKVIFETNKSKECETSKKSIETKCKDESKKQNEELSTINKELATLQFKLGKATDDFNIEKNKREKCVEINKQAITGTQKKCESRLQRIKEEYDFIVKDVKQLYENLNATCINEKKDLNDKIAKAAKDLSTCEVSSLKKFNQKKNEAEKCQADLDQEKEDKVNHYVIKTECDRKVKTAEDEKVKLENAIENLKKEKICPICPPCREKAFAKDIETLTSKVQKLEASNKDSINTTKRLTDQNVILNKHLMDTEKKCKQDLDKANKDLTIKLDKEKTDCKKITTLLEADKKTLMERNSKLIASEDKCLKDLEIKKQNIDSKDLLDKCLKEKENTNIKMGEFKASVDKCERELKELLKTKNNLEIAGKENNKRIENFENQLKSKTEEAEKIRKLQSDKESQCSDLIFELKGKLLTQFNDLESIRYNMEAKNTLIEGYLKKLGTESSTDKVKLENLVKQNDQKIKFINELNTQLAENKKILNNLETTKNEKIKSLIEKRAKLTDVDIKIFKDELNLIDKNIESSQILIKQLDISLDKQNASVNQVNIEIGIIEKKLQSNDEDKESIQSVLSQYKEIVNKIKNMITENKTLFEKYSKKIEDVIKEAIKAGNLNDKYEKIFFEFHEKLKSVETNIEVGYNKIQEDIKNLNEKNEKEKANFQAELQQAKYDKNAQCFEELNFAINNIKLLNNNKIAQKNEIKVNANNNNNLVIESQFPIDINEIRDKIPNEKNNNKNNNNDSDLNNCLNIITNKIYSENNCALLEPLRAKYNETCRKNQLLAPNKEVLTFATQSGKDSNKSMLKRLSSKKF